MIKKLMKRRGLLREPEKSSSKYEIAQIEQTQKTHELRIHLSKDGQKLPRSVIVITTPSKSAYFNN